MRVYTNTHTHHLHLLRVQLGRYGRRYGELDPPAVLRCLSVHLCREQGVHGATSAANSQMAGGKKEKKTGKPFGWVLRSPLIILLPGELEVKTAS